MIFLDVKVIADSKVLHHDLHCQETFSQIPISYQMPPTTCVFNSTADGSAIRICGKCSKPEWERHHLLEFTEYLLNCGYKKKTLVAVLKKKKKRAQNHLRAELRQIPIKNIVPWVTTYDPR